MIHRQPARGERLDVAGLNEITVLIDRSETELTEVGINAWQPGLDGPPHAHARKEQNFLVLSGRGRVRIGAESHAASPGAFFYLPAGVIHQTITEGTAPLVYLLFNAFLDVDKEGHASFAEHIALVRATRRRQADAQRAEEDPDLAAAPAAEAGWVGRCVRTEGLAAPRTVLLGREESARCEAVHLRIAPGEDRALGPDPAVEQTVAVLSGSGRCTVGLESVAISAGEVVFIPRRADASVHGGADGLVLVSFGTVVVR